MKYRLTIKRTREDFGSVEIEAQNAEEAERKYLNPNWDEELIFDDEIEWDEDDGEYEVIDVEEVK